MSGSVPRPPWVRPARRDNPRTCPPTAERAWRALLRVLPGRESPRLWPCPQGRRAPSDPACCIAAVGLRPGPASHAESSDAPVHLELSLLTRPCLAGTRRGQVCDGRRRADFTREDERRCSESACAKRCRVVTAKPTSRLLPESSVSVCRPRGGAHTTRTAAPLVRHSITSRRETEFRSAKHTGREFRRAVRLLACRMPFAACRRRKPQRTFRARFWPRGHGRAARSGNPWNRFQGNEAGDPESRILVAEIHHRRAEHPGDVPTVAASCSAPGRAACPVAGRRPTAPPTHRRRQ
jgi:hypothetical protein